MRDCGFLILNDFLEILQTSDRHRDITASAFGATLLKKGQTLTVISCIASPTIDKY